MRRQCQEGRTATNQRVDLATYLGLQLEATVSWRLVVSAENLQADGEQRCKVYRAPHAQPLTLLEDPGSKRGRPGGPPVRGAQRLVRVRRRDELPPAALLRQPIPTGGEDGLHRVTEVAHEGTRSCEGLNDPVLIGAGILVFVTYHHGVTLSNGACNSRCSMEQEIHSPSQFGVAIEAALD